MCRKFICYGCKEEHITDTPVNDILQEFEDNFGESLNDYDKEVVSLCDACHNIFIKEYNNKYLTNEDKCVTILPP